MIFRTDAIVLRSMDYRETSRIVTLFTRERGKLTVLAKGARQPKSKFGATLQPMAHIQVVFYYKETRTLQTLSESAHLELFTGLGQQLGKITLGLRLVELVQALMADEEANPAVFNLLVTALRRLDAAPARYANLLPYFMIRLATILGFAPALDRAQVQALPEAGGVLTLDRGLVLPPGPTPERVRQASRAALRAFAICTHADLDTILRMAVGAEAQHELLALAEAFLQYHTEEAFPHRSDKVLAQLSRPPHPASEPRKM